MLAAFLRALFFYILSLPCCAETISLPFYRRRAARKQYFCHFIVAVQRGNNIFAVLSSPCSAETISLPFYRRRAAREQYLCISSFAALLRALKFLFSSLQNGGTCWNGRGGACVPARTSAQRRFHTKIYLRITHEDLTMDAPLQGDTGGHTGTAPTKLHHAFPCNPPMINGHIGRVPAIPFIV